MEKHEKEDVYVYARREQVVERIRRLWPLVAPCPKKLVINPQNVVVDINPHWTLMNNSNYMDPLRTETKKVKVVTKIKREVNIETEQVTENFPSQTAEPVRELPCPPLICFKPRIAPATLPATFSSVNSNDMDPLRTEIKIVEVMTEKNKIVEVLTEIKREIKIETEEVMENFPSQPIRELPCPPLICFKPRFAPAALPATILNVDTNAQEQRDTTNHERNYKPRYNAGNPRIYTPEQRERKRQLDRERMRAKRAKREAELRLRERRRDADAERNRNRRKQTKAQMVKNRLNNDWWNSAEFQERRRQQLEQRIAATKGECIVPLNDKLQSKKRERNLLKDPDLAQEALTCPTCQRIFSWKKNIDHHKLQCAKGSIYLCPYCEFCSKRVSTLAMHMRYWHLAAFIQDEQTANWDPLINVSVDPLNTDPLGTDPDPLGTEETGMGSEVMIKVEKDSDAEIETRVWEAATREGATGETIKMEIKVENGGEIREMLVENSDEAQGINMQNNVKLKVKSEVMDTSVETRVQNVFEAGAHTHALNKVETEVHLHKEYDFESSQEDKSAVENFDNQRTEVETEFDGAHFLITTGDALPHICTNGEASRTTSLRPRGRLKKGVLEHKEAERREMQILHRRICYFLTSKLYPNGEAYECRRKAPDQNSNEARVCRRKPSSRSSSSSSSSLYSPSSSSSSDEDDSDKEELNVKTHQSESTNGNTLTKRPRGRPRRVLPADEEWKPSRKRMASKGGDEQMPAKRARVKRI